MRIQIDGVRAYPNVHYPSFSVTLNGKNLRLETKFSLIVENDGIWTATVQVGLP